MMMKFVSPLGVVALALACSSGAVADLVVYSDGSAHSLSSASTNYYELTNQSTLQVQGGGSITPTASSTTGTYGVLALSGTVNVNGGAITGGTSTLPNGYAGGNAILSENSTSVVTITSGQVTGGAGITGGAGVVIQNAGPTTIGGGTITGGKTTLNGVQGGSGIVYEGGSTLNISGGTISGGASTGSIPFTGYSLVDDGGGNVAVSGGQFLSSIYIHFTSEPSELDFFGSGLGFNSITNRLTGTLGDGSSINQLIQIYESNPTDFAIITNASDTEVSFVFSPTVAPPVPEPASIVLMAVGLGGFALALRSRRK